MYTRRHQMFPSLLPAEIDRLRQFGILRAHGAGSSLVQVGEVGHGLTIVVVGMPDRLP
jgi:thioredoxin reductase (NADPH)